MSDGLVDCAKNVQSLSDFRDFLVRLNTDLKDSKANWENDDLADYLEGLSGFCLSMDGYFRNAGEVVDLKRPTWNLVAQMLVAATVYE
jgi:hypothetical protein